MAFLKDVAQTTVKAMIRYMLTVERLNDIYRFIFD